MNENYRNTNEFMSCFRLRCEKLTGNTPATGKLSKKWMANIHECSTMLRLKWLHKCFRRDIIILDKLKRTVHKKEYDNEAFAG